MHIKVALAGLLGLAAGIWASPAPIIPLDPRVVQPLNELEIRNPMELARTQYVEKRLSADFSLQHTWNNEVLFGGSWIDSGEHDAESVSLKVTCLECWTKGVVTAKLVAEDLIMPVVRLNFAGVEAYVNLEVAASAGATYAINLFSTNSPLGLGFPGLSLGLVFHLDLVFSLSSQIDLTGGFYVKIADDAFLETTVLDGKIIDHFFDGLSSKSIPVTVKSGSATFKADLRLRVQCGAEIDGSSMLIPMPGIGAGALVGIYANLIEFVAVLESTPTCALQTREWFDLNVGAYVRFDVVLDFKTIGAIPTVSTTLLNSPTFTQCWIENSPHTTGGVVLTTTVATGLPPSYQTLSLPGGSGSGGGSGSVQSTVSTVITSTITATGAASETSPASAVSSGAHGPGPVVNTTSAAEDGLITTTIYSTTVYTATSCGAAVINCPASWQKEIIVTKTVDSFTTVCPPGADVAFPTASASASAAPTAASSPAGPVAVAVEQVTEVIVLSVCPTPVVETFVAPTTVAPPTEHHVTVVMPAPTTAILPVVVAAAAVVPEVKPWSNSTAPSYASLVVSKPSAGFASPSVASFPAKPTFTAGAGRPVSGLCWAAAAAVAGLWIAL